MADTLEQADVRIWASLLGVPGAPDGGALSFIAGADQQKSAIVPSRAAPFQFAANCRARLHLSRGSDRPPVKLP